MLKLSRLSAFAALTVLILLVQVTAFAGNGQSQEPSAGNADKAQTSKSTKKRKKKKVTTATPVAVFAAPVFSAQTPAPVVVKSVAITPTEAAPAPRNTASAARANTGVYVSPSGTPVETAASAGQLIISEFRVRGPNGANDEFIEIYNKSGADHTVSAASGTGYGIAASDGTTRCSIPNGTVIPNRGHYLCVNSVGYSLASYPAGNGTTATGDATYTTDIPDNAGIALFNNNSGGGSYILANRIDAVGSTSEANTLYKEGTGYSALTPFSIDYSFYRDTCGKGGSITTLGGCDLGGNPKDTDNNAADFIFVDTNGTSAGAGQRLGAPGPENLSSPIQRNASISAVVLDTCAAAAAPPNRVRDFTSDPANNSTFGTLDIRRTFTNNTGGNVTRLRYRVMDLTTFPAPSGFADLRPRTSTAIVVTVDRPPCGSGTSNVTVQGTTLEQPPSQPNGGGFNSSLSSGTVTLATPLANGASIDVRFLLGIQQTGTFKLNVNIEALP
ncbi:MAG TPA: lamin tail domain-containing protein [Pyrinomonadaceae bacterium]